MCIQKSKVGHQIIHVLIFQVYGAISEDGKFIFIFICLIVEPDLVDDDEIVNIGLGSRNL